MYAVRAEAQVLSPEEVEAMIRTTPVSLLPKVIQARLIREACDIQFGGLPSYSRPMADEPDQRGFMIGGVRL